MSGRSTIFEFWTVATCFLFFIIITILIGNFFTGSHDSKVEETVEDVIHHFSGADIDLSWDSPETGHLP